jgi:hypothetical protein
MVCTVAVIVASVVLVGEGNASVAVALTGAAWVGGWLGVGVGGRTVVAELHAANIAIAKSREKNIVILSV